MNLLSWWWFVVVGYSDVVMGFWDEGTTTVPGAGVHQSADIRKRQSFFRWNWVAPEWMQFWYPHWDWDSIGYSRRLNVIAGISIDFIPLGCASILNRRALLTAGNFLDPHMNRQEDLRVWALGRLGDFQSPYRYRVWRVRRLYPKTINPEQQHGSDGKHAPRHDIAVIHTLDQMYIYASRPNTFHYAYRTFLPHKHQALGFDLHFAGSGYETLKHIRENYKIMYSRFTRTDVRNCEAYTAKFWGKFICAKNLRGLAGIPNGGGLFSDDYLYGMPCFEVRFNEDRIMVFTDLRYYIDMIHIIANYTPGEYYEYAYPQWSIQLGWLFDSEINTPFMPEWQTQFDIFPLGK